VKFDLQRLCLDTNIYIIGTQEIHSPEAKILRAIGYYDDTAIPIEAEIVLSDEIIDQVRRVGKYLWNKDKAGFVIGLIWSRLNIHYVNYTQEWNQELEKVVTDREIPNEDIEVYLTAKLGNSDCFVSSNRELIRAIATFECLTPKGFINNYLESE
jgi:predicted nucleic acid-binding protein